MKAVSHIEEITFARLDDATLRTYAELKYDGTGMNELKEDYIKLMGYDPGNKLKNKQVCIQCGRPGYLCPGHPIRLNLGIGYLTPFHEKVMSVLFRTFCGSCGHVVHAPTKASDTDIYVFSRNIGSANYKRHTGCALFTKIKAKVYVPNVDDDKKPSEPDGEDKNENGKRKHRPKMKFLAESIDTIRAFINLLDANDLGIFGLSKANICRLFNNEIILLPKCLQPSDERTHRSKHMSRHMDLITFLRGTKGTLSDPKILPILYAIMAKLLIAKTEDDISFRRMCEGKTGLFRGTALRKRAKGTARAVLTPDDCLDGIFGGTNARSGMGILRCSDTICKTLKRLYIVSVHNINRLQSEVGTSVSHIVRNGVYIKLSGRQASGSTLQLGDKVLVSIRDDDIVFFGRYPTLHKMSLIAYKIRQWEKKCIGLPQVNTPGHNADFDGDEGNLHVGEDSASRLESEACFVNYNVIGNKDGNPVVGITYNGIIGCYMLSQDDNIDDVLFAKLARIIGIDPNHHSERARALSVPIKSGRTIISMLLPSKLSYTNGDVIIKDGFMLSGKLKKSDVGDKLIAAIYEIDRFRTDGDADKPTEGYTNRFIDVGYKVASFYAGCRGITMGIDDYSCLTPRSPKDVPPVAYDDAFIDIVGTTGSALLVEVNAYVDQVERKKASMTESSRQNMETQVVNLVGGLGVLTGERTKAYLATKEASGVGNTADISYLSGARGSIDNVVSAIAPLGQLYSKNRRLMSDVRLTPYSDVGSKRIEDNGFILSSYACGLSPKELSQQAIIGRQSAWDMYNGTPEAGAASRQCCVHLDGIVIDDQFRIVGREGEVLSYLYGTSSDTMYTSPKPCPLGKQQSCIDMVAILQDFK